MRQDWPHGRQTFSHSFNTSGQVDYQGRPPDSRNCPGQGRAGCDFQAFYPHQLGNARNTPVDHGLRRFRRHITRGKPRTSRGDHQLITFIARPAKPRFYIGSLVRQNLNSRNVETGLFNLIRNADALAIVRDLTEDFRAQIDLVLEELSRRRIRV